VGTKELDKSPSPSDENPAGRRHLGPLIAIGAVFLFVIAFVTSAFALSGSSLSGGSSGLAQLDTQAFGGNVESLHATGPGGRPIPVWIEDGRVLPKRKLRPGEMVSIDAVVKRPGWVGWLAGDEDTVHLTVRAPQARVKDRWLTVAKSSKPTVTFDEPVHEVAYGNAGELSRHRFDSPRRSLQVGSEQVAGTVIVRAAARPWERLGRPQSVTWFPASGSTTLAASPAAGSEVSPSAPLRITFSKPASKVLGTAKPKLSPELTGHWRQVDSHTLLFRPSGYGAALATHLTAALPKPVEVIEADGSLHRTAEVQWQVPGGSTLREQQLLAQAGYLPLHWTAKGAGVPRTPAAQASAAVRPPKGSFRWRYHNVPAALKELWTPGEENVMTEGALMSFEEDHEMETDGVAGPEAWRALMAAAVAGETKSEPGYSYVHVSESLPEELYVWHDGKTAVTALANTGIPGAETEQGTFPVFEHLEETTMSGENPDGSHYEDPGIKWVSYFNGGDALHAFDRASFGSPQSLGCVEMQLEDAEAVYPYTPIGTLVTVAG
jgi:L,D-transpeptidase catalytic domain